MNETPKKILQFLRESDKMHKRLHARIRAIEDALIHLGLSQTFLDTAYQKHLLDRQVRDEDLLGPGPATEHWSDEDDPESDPSPQPEK